MDRVALVRRGSATSLALTSLYAAGRYLHGGGAGELLDFVGSTWSSEGRASEELEEVGQCDCREVCRLLQDEDVEEVPRSDALQLILGERAPERDVAALAGAVVQVVVSKMVGMMARCCRRRPMVTTWQSPRTMLDSSRRCRQQSLTQLFPR